MKQTKRIWRCVWQVAHQHHVLRWWRWHGVVFVDGGVQRSRRHEDLIVHLHTYKAARDGSGCVTEGVRSDQLSRVDVSQRHTTPLSSSLRKKVHPARLLETRGRRHGHGTDGLPCADVRLCPGQRQAPRATTPPPRMCEKDWSRVQNEMNHFSAPLATLCTRKVVEGNTVQVHPCTSRLT
jgi:hypothetical protein